ncbi:MAG: type I secretion system permease/ATPase [Paracoccaceae bacterium]
MQGPQAANPYRQALGGLGKTFLAVGLASAAVNLLMLTGPLFMMQIYDRVLSSGSVPTLVGLFTIVTILYGFLALYDFLRVRLLSRAAYRLDHALGGRGFAAWVRSARAGNPALHRPLSDLAIVRGFLSGPAVPALFDLPCVPAYLLLIFLLHPWLGLLTLCGAVLVCLATLLGQRLTEGCISRAMQHEAAESFLIEQGFRNAETIRALGMEGRVTARWRQMHDAGLAAGQIGGDRAELLAATTRAFRLLLQSATLALGAYLAIRQEISAGLIMAISIIAGKALAPIDQIVGQWRAIQRAKNAHARLNVAMAGVADRPAPLALPAPTGQLSVQALTKFAPGQVARGEQAPLLANVSFDLAAGEALGVIGPSASGKSTLARLLVGAWQADAGTIRLDGATFDQWQPDDLGRHIGYLPQQVELISGSIRDNICRFDPDADDAAIVEIARMTGVHEMILGLPKAYGTEMGHAGHPLSGGQLQRIGLARALYGRPRLIVLDEPNSNLDAVGEEALAAAILQMRKAGAAVVVMAHRPSALAAVNKVMVLQNGQVSHFGDRDRVLAETTRPRPVAAPQDGMRQVAHG